MPRRAAGVYALWAWLFILLGMAFAVLGPALPALRADYRVSLSDAGLVFALHSAGYLAGVFAAGAWSDVRGRRLVAGVGLAGLAAGMALAALAPAWPLFLASIVLAGGGFAFVDVGLNAGIGDAVAGTGRRAAAMNLLHSAFPIGTLAAPAGLGLAWGYGLGWRTVFLLIGAAIALSLVAFLPRALAWPRGAPQDGEAAGSRPGRRPGARRTLRLLREPYLRKLAAIQGLYVGAEVGIAGWLATYVVEEFGGGEAFGAAATAAFWGSFLAGRPAVAYLSRRFAPQRVLPWLFVSGLGVAVAGALAPTATAATAAYVLAGAAICGIFPTVMALALEGRRDDAGAATAVITAAAAVGGLAWPWLMGVIAGAVGLRPAMAAAAIPLAAMLALATATRPRPGPAL